MLTIQARNRELARREWVARSLTVERLLAVAPLALVPAAVGFWLWSLQGVDLRRMNDLGLVSVLGPGFLVALVLLTASFTSAVLRRRPSELGLLAHVLVLILVLYGTVPLLDTVPQGTAVYNHLGVADYVSHHGHVDREIDAYFNWPGFFVMTSALTGLAGAASAFDVARFGPLVFNLLYIAPLVLLFRTGIRAERRSATYVWLCVWLFFCANWVGQDAYSPQAFGYLAYLCTVALLVSVFRPRVGKREEFGAAQRAAVLAVVALGYVAIAISHQLTPYALVVASLALVVTRATRVNALPGFMAVVAVLWFAYSAVPFFQQFLREQGRNIGAVSENVNSGLGARLAGSPEHLFVVHTRVAFTLLLWSLVPVGIWLRRRRGLGNRSFLALAASGVLLVGLQSYGGEILLRVYLFSLPGVLVFVAAVAVVNGLGPVARGGLVASLSLVLLSLFVFARYGNARIDYFSPQEVAAVDHLYRVAPPGSLLLAGTLNLPWRSQGYAAYDYEMVDELDSWSAGTGPRAVDRVAREVVRTMRAHRRPGAFLVFARSMEPWEQFLDLRRAGELARVRRAVVATGLVRLVYHDEDTAIYTLRPAA